MPNIWVGLGIVILGLSGLLWFQTERLDTAQKEYVVLETSVKTLGEQAKRDAKEKDDQNKLKAGKANAKIKLLTASNNVLNQRLLDARASSSYVPPASGDSTSPSTANFDRAKLESAIQRLDAEVQGIIETGDRNRIALDNAKEWARDITN